MQHIRFWNIWIFLQLEQRLLIILRKVFMINVYNVMKIIYWNLSIYHAFLYVVMGFQQKKKYVMTRTISNLMDATNGRKVACWNAQIVMQTNVISVLMVGSLQIMAAINIVEMVKLLNLLGNNVVMEIMIKEMDVINVNLSEYLITDPVLIGILVWFVKNTLNYLTILVDQYVEMIILQMNQRNVKMETIFLMMCEKECEICGQGTCVQCIDGYIIAKDYCEVNNQTFIDNDKDEVEQTQCANAMYTNNEECDDGNKIDGDGCSAYVRLKLIGFLITNSIRLAFVLLILLQNCNTLIKLNKINTFNTFNYPLQIKLNQMKLFQILLIKLDHLFPQLNKAYIILLQFLQLRLIRLFYLMLSMNFKLNFWNPLQQQIFSQLRPKPNEGQNITLNYQFIITKSLEQNQLQTASNFQALGNWMIYWISQQCLFLFLFGNPSQCMEILDTLQIQSYLKFIQPNSSDFVTINPVLVKLQVDDFLQQLIGYEYLESIGKLFEYQLNANLLVNIYGQFIQIVFLSGLYIVIKYYQKIIYSYFFGSKYIYYIRLLNNKIIQYIGIKFYYLNKLFLKQMRYLMSTDQQINAGFIQISFLILALFSPLVRCGYQFYLKSKTFYLKQKKKRAPEIMNVREIFVIAERNE
ncbi:unnamed protein product [Paramecium octaurelia]|uniref:Transmembrane protein n=1 Tax=Paramecium octaurelia TaxID=43137 RepID=A0A8S1YRZ5_PAROT|nr:unnamed protein product [Paramecium octaurelia]